MGQNTAKYEIDRVNNLVKSFGWVVLASIIDEDKVKVEFEKTLTGMNPNMKGFEVDRIVGMIRNIGWSVVSSRFADDKAIVEFEKVVKEVI